jgi:hypothetical protein
MSRNNNLHDVELLPVLRVSIDPWRCAGRLGPSFVESVNAAGHMFAKGVTGRGKDENMAYRSLVKISTDIEAMEKSASINPEAMQVLLKEQRTLFNRFLVLRAARKGQTPPSWAIEPPGQWSQQPTAPPGYAPPAQPYQPAPGQHQSYPPQSGMYQGQPPPPGQYPSHPPQPGMYRQPPPPGQYPGHPPQPGMYPSHQHPPGPGAMHHPPTASGAWGHHAVPTAVPVMGQPGHGSGHAPFKRAQSALRNVTAFRSGRPP